MGNVHIRRSMFLHRPPRWNYRIEQHPCPSVYSKHAFLTKLSHRAISMFVVPYSKHASSTELPYRTVPMFVDLRSLTRPLDGIPCCIVHCLYSTSVGHPYRQLGHGLMDTLDAAVGAGVVKLETALVVFRNSCIVWETLERQPVV